MFLGFFLRFKHLPGCRNIQVRDYFFCFLVMLPVPVKMGQGRSLGHCGNSWTFLQWLLIFFIYFIIVLCLTWINHHHYTIRCLIFSLRVISLLLVWLVFDLHGQLRSMHHSFWTAGGNNIIPKQAVNKDATVFFELYHSSRKSFIYVSSVVCCVCGVVWMFYGLTFICYLMLSFVVRCSLFVARFIPIHSASISWNNFTLGNCTQQIWSMYHRRAKVRNWPNQAMVFWNNWTTTPRGVYHRKILWRIKVFEMMVRITCVHPQQDDRW